MTPREEELRTYTIKPIGFVHKKENKEILSILQEYKSGLKNLNGFSHLQVIWWFSHFDNLESRKTLIFDQMPFEAPESGVFACRSPLRPNPIGLSTVKIVALNADLGQIEIVSIDADDQTPILDLKPYLPSSNRVKDPQVAEWASNWPEWTPA